MHGTDARSVSFHRSRVRSDRRLTYGEVDEIFAGRARAEEPWAARSRPRARWPRALAGKRDAVEIGTPEPTFDFDADGHVTGRALRGADRVAPPDRAADDPRQRAGGRLPRRPPPADALPRARAPRARRGGVPDRAARRASTSRRRRSPKHMTPQQAADVAAEASRIVAREPRGRARVRRAGAARAQAGLLLPEQPRPRRPRRARATATSRRRSGATRTWSRTARCCRASASTTPPRPPHELRRGGRALVGDRARGDEDRARGRRRLPGLPARAPPAPRPIRPLRPCSRARSSA